MFCRHCGFEISEQARFCPRCGQAVAPASGAAASHGEEALGRATPAGGAPPTSAPQTPPAQATTSQPAPAPAPTAPEPAPTPQGKKRRRGVAVTLVAAAFVLVTVGICAVFLSRAGFGQTMSVGAHLLDEAVPVSRWAHIVPVDDAGTPLAGQFVRFVGAGNEAGERSQVKGEVYDATTGKQIEVWDALGLSKDELDAQAVDAIVAYAKMKPAQKSPYKSDEELTEAVRTFVEEGRGSYLLCDVGVTYFLPEESLGYSASEGSKEILVLPAESKSLTGVDFRPYYKLLSPGILKQGE